MTVRRPTVFNFASRATTRRILPSIKDGDRVLDLGAGKCLKGWYLKKSKKIKLTNLDIYRDKNALLPVILYDGQKVPFSADSFDVVLLLGVLHHEEERSREETVREARRVSRRAILILEDTPKNGWERRWNRVWDRVLNWHNKDAEFYSYFSQKKWEACFRKLGMKVKQKREVRSPASWLSFYTRTLYVLEK